MELGSNLVQSYFNRANVYGRIKRYEDALVDFEKASSLGVLEAAQKAAQIRVMQLGAVGLEPKSRLMEVGIAFVALQKANSIEGMRRAVVKYPFMTSSEFENFIAQRDSGSEFEQRLGLFRHIANEQ